MADDDEGTQGEGQGDPGVGVRGGPGRIDWDEIEGGQGGESSLGEEGQGDLDETERSPGKVDWDEIERGEGRESVLDDEGQGDLSEPENG